MKFFYVCKILDIQVTMNDLEQEFNLVVQKGEKYIKCKYLRKFSEKKDCIQYKLLPRSVFVLSAEFISPMVMLVENLALSFAECQGLPDSI